MRSTTSGLAAACALAALSLSGCGGGGAPPTGGGATPLRLGYFPNLTHATAIVGVETGIFAEELGPHRLSVTTFNAGPAAVEALFSGAVDATYLGPNPAINAFARSGGEAVRIVAGATSGGAALVVRPSISGPADLRGRKLATPQLGNTQDVALRHWLREHGLRTDPHGGGDVSILPQENAQTLDTFRSGAVDGAWVPEPWATRLVQEGGGKALIDERDLWPGGRFVTTHLVVRTEFLKRQPDAVRRLVQGQVRANEVVNTDPGEAQRIVDGGIAKVTGRGIPPAVMAAAWANLEFTNDPVAASLRASADHAAAVGLLDRVDLSGIYDLRALNAVLRDAHQPEVRG
jgi:NitT/TauT family transport system substrate-binding protein